MSNPIHFEILRELGPRTVPYGTLLERSKDVRSTGNDDILTTRRIYICIQGANNWSFFIQRNCAYTQHYRKSFTSRTTSLQI